MATFMLVDTMVTVVHRSFLIPTLRIPGHWWQKKHVVAVWTLRQLIWVMLLATSKLRNFDFSKTE
jgi:hypothetical protein